MKHIPWDVFVIEENGNYTYTKLMDTVFYDENCDAQYVYKGLVDHDGYPQNIIVRNDRIHQDLHGRSLDDYAYDEELDLEDVEAMYIHPLDNGL